MSHLDLIFFAPVMIVPNLGRCNHSNALNAKLIGLNSLVPSPLRWQEASKRATESAIP